MQRCKGQGRPARRGTAQRGARGRYSRHFLWMALVRLLSDTISWRAKTLARCVSSRHGAHSGWLQVLQKHMVSKSASAQSRSQLAHCASSEPSAELSTRN